MLLLIALTNLPGRRLGPETPTGNGVQFWQRNDVASNACPRPASLTGSEFNAQETGLRALRRAGVRSLHPVVDSMNSLRRPLRQTQQFISAANQTISLSSTSL